MLSYPTPEENEETYLIAIKAHQVSIVAGVFAQLCNRYEWESDQDYEAAYNAFSFLRGCMLSCPLSELVESNNRIYRLLDAAFFGTVYDVVDNDPLTIEPAIPPVPSPAPLMPGNIAQLEDTRLKLQAIIDALAASGESDEALLEQLIAIAGLLV